VSDNYFQKALRVSQGHLEIGLYRWQAVMSRYDHITKINQLPEAELDKIIAEMERLKQEAPTIAPPQTQTKTKAPKTGQLQLTMD